MVAETLYITSNTNNINVSYEESFSSGKDDQNKRDDSKRLKEEMDKLDINWSEVVREAIRRRLENEHEKGVVEAVLLNERLKRKAPKGWDGAK